MHADTLRMMLHGLAPNGAKVQVVFMDSTGATIAVAGYDPRSDLANGWRRPAGGSWRQWSGIISELPNLRYVDQDVPCNLIEVE